MRKIIIIAVLMIIFVLNGFGQTKINFGKYEDRALFVNKTNFNLFDNWKVIHREYIVEMEHTYESLLINDSRRRKQGELIYGRYVKISKKSFEAYCPYIAPIIINPVVKFVENKYNEGEHGLFPQLNGKKILNAEIRCSQNPNFVDDTPDIYITILNPNLIVIHSDNTYTFLKRAQMSINESILWQIDSDGFNYVKMRGHSNFQFSIDTLQENGKKLFFLFKMKKRNSESYIFIENFVKNNTICTYQWKTKYLFGLKDSLKTYLSYDLSLLKSNNNLFRVTGSNEDENEEWVVKWKVTDKIKKIILTKSLLYSHINQTTKMYLLKGDEVEILEEKDDWLKIRYYGKKTIEGWIKRSDVE